MTTKIAYAVELTLLRLTIAEDGQKILLDRSATRSLYSAGLNEAQASEAFNACQREIDRVREGITRHDA